MSRVAIFTDSASDLDPGRRRGRGHPRRPAAGQLRHRDVQGRRRPVGRGVLGADGRAGRAVPDDRGVVARASSRRPTRRPSTAGAEAIVSIHVAGTLSGTIKSAQIARDMLPDREIHVVDSLGASMAEGILARMGVEMAADDRPAAEIAETLESRAPGHADVRRARDARVPQEGRPHQRRAGGDRDAALGQADHHGQARRGRDGRPGPHPGQGARAAHRADHASGRSSGSRSCTR